MISQIKPLVISIFFLGHLISSSMGSQGNYCPSYRLQEEEVPNNSYLKSYSLKEIRRALAVK